MEYPYRLQTDVVQSCVAILQAHSSHNEVMHVAADLLTSIARFPGDGKMETVQNGGSKSMTACLLRQASVAAASLTIHNGITHKIVDYFLLLASDPCCCEALRAEGCTQAIQALLQETYQSAAEREVNLKTKCIRLLSSLVSSGEGRLCKDACVNVCQNKDSVRGGEATAIVMVAQSLSGIGFVADEMRQVSGVDDFSAVLAELAFMGSSIQVQTLFASMMLTVAQVVANDEKLLPDMASPLLELLKK